jgi:hypothetical protein
MDEVIEHDEIEVGGHWYCVGESTDYWNLAWSSDWNGDEVGYDNIDVVGLYQIPGTEIHMYVDTEEGTILEMWEVKEDE